jgi:imidazolonepropionase-like amidohydrolase
VEWGMKPIDAIQAATINAADLIGLPDKIGSLESGHYADLIAVNGDPLTDVKILEDVKFVLKGGSVVKNDLAK